MGDTSYCSPGQKETENKGNKRTGDERAGDERKEGAEKKGARVEVKSPAAGNRGSGAFVSLQQMLDADQGLGGWRVLTSALTDDEYWDLTLAFASLVSFDIASIFGL